MNKIYGPQHINFLTENIKGKSLNEISNMFNEHFGLNIKQTSIISLIYRLGLHNERDTRFNKGWEPTQFKKGHVPSNKGKKKDWIGGEETQFKKGHVPVNHRPVGSERVNVDGYTEIKVAEPKKWRLKHNVIWEEHNGPIPKGHCVIFGDGDSQNLDINNLILISRRELAVLNHHGLIKSDAELTKTGIIIANIKMKMSDVKKRA